MKYNKKYIKNILTHTDNFSEIFLREMGAHSSIKSFSKEIKDIVDSSDSLKNNFFKISDFFYDQTVTNNKIYSKSTILKNVLTVNSLQLEKIKKIEEENNAIVIDDYMDERDNWAPEKNSRITLTKKIKDFPLNLHKRSLVMYFRCHPSFKNPKTEKDYTKFGVDIFQFILIYYFLKRFIKERRSRVFNNIYVVSRFNFLPELYYHLFEDIEHKISYSDDFIFNTSFFANTLHFYGGRLPERDLFSIPILCDGFRIQTNWMDLIPKKIFLPFFYYNGFIGNNGELIPDNDREYYRGDKAFSWADVIDKDYIKQENTSLNNIFKYLNTMIVSLEEELLAYEK